MTLKEEPFTVDYKYLRIIVLKRVFTTVLLKPRDSSELNGVFFATHDSRRFRF